MINLFGKTLVYLNTALSLMFLIFAVWIFTQPEDFGRKEPRKAPGGERVPSELLKRTVALAKFSKPKAGALAHLELAQQKLRIAYYKWPSSHLWMKKELEKLQSEPGNIAKKEVNVDPKGYPVTFRAADAETTVREVAFKDGAILQRILGFPVYQYVIEDGALKYQPEKLPAGKTPPPRPVNVPVLGTEAKVKYTELDPKTKQLSQKDASIDKSLATYRQELADVRMQIKEINDTIYRWLFEQKQISVYLNGGQVMFPNWWLAMHGQSSPWNQLVFVPEVLGQYAQDAVPAPQVPGLYRLLLDREKEIQDKMKKEIDHIRPQWVRILIDSQLQLERQENLRLRLEELKTRMKTYQAGAGK